MVFRLRTFDIVNGVAAGENSEVHTRQLKRFTLRELRVATQNFSSYNIVGRGGFGSVYKGILVDGSVVAIKRLANDSLGGNQQFNMELQCGELAMHPNLCALIGFYEKKRECLLVYPFMVHGSVESHLRGHGQRPLDWQIRKRIALGVARALRHLHDHPEFKVIHRDVKASNVLLDRNFEAVLTDFGLARFLSRSGSTQNGNLVPAAARDRPTKRPISGQLERGKQAKYARKQGLSCWQWSKTEVAFDQTGRMQIEPPMPIAGDGSMRSQGVSCWYWSRTNFNYSSDSFENSMKYTLSVHSLSCWQWSRMEAKLASTSSSPEEIVAARGRQSRVDSTTHYYSEDHDTQITTCVRGTIGHLAPEYLMSGRCSVKTDVYAYGIMLLEIISGQRAYNLTQLAQKSNCSLIDWVSQNLKENRLEKLVDSNIQGINTEEVEQMIRLALFCTQDSPQQRPKMVEVVTMLLQGDGLAERWEKWLLDEEMNPGQYSNLYGSSSSKDEVDSVSCLPAEVLSGPR